MRWISFLLAVLLAVVPPWQRVAAADAASVHVVESGELRQALVEKSLERSRNEKEIRTVLRHQVIRGQLGDVFDLERVEEALPTLDDETLRQLAAESARINDQIQAAGLTGPPPSPGMSKSTIVLIVLAVTLVILIVLAANTESSS